MAETVNILSNVQSIDGENSAEDPWAFVKVDTRPWPFMRQCLGADLVIIDSGDQGKLYLACLLRPFANFRLVSVDIILRSPTGVKSRLLARIKSLLLKQVDRFILFFKNTAGYERYYGIERRKVVYIPFKVNGLDEKAFPSAVPDGEYVLCAGRTLRDLNTFVAAMAEAGCPGILLQQREAITCAHGTEQYQGVLPENLRLQIDLGNKLNSFIEMIAGAKIVVVPRYRHDICCTGISTYLTAMALGKCVIVTKGPGAEDILTDQAIFVEPEDPGALAEAIRALWTDDARRRAVAAAGRRYAEACGGSVRLSRDILRASLDGWRSTAPGRRDPAARN